MSDSLQVILLICARAWKYAAASHRLWPHCQTSAFYSNQQNFRRSTHCSAACAGPSVLSSWGRAIVALAAAAGCRLFSLFAPTAVPLCTSAA